jgi:hypothetical protein
MTELDAMAARYQAEADDSTVIARFFVRAWLAMAVSIALWNVWTKI